MNFAPTRTSKELNYVGSLNCWNKSARVLAPSSSTDQWELHKYLNGKVSGRNEISSACRSPCFDVPWSCSCWEFITRRACNHEVLWRNEKHASSVMWASIKFCCLRHPRGGRRDKKKKKLHDELCALNLIFVKAKKCLCLCCWRSRNCDREKFHKLNFIF